MGLSLKLIIKNNIHLGSDKKAAHDMIVATCERLNKLLCTQGFKVFQEPNSEDYAIIDQRDYPEINSIELYDGFWMLCSGWKPFQYLDEVFDVSVRDTLYKYIRLFDAGEAYVCTQRMTWDASFWDFDNMTFEKWIDGCEKYIGHPVTEFDIETARLNDNYIGDYDVYLDRFMDLKS